MATVYSLVCFGGLSGKTVTFTDAGDVVNLTNHGLRQGVTGVVFSTTGTLPTGIVAGTTYYPRNGADAGKFTIYPTKADALAGTNQRTFTGTGSGTHTVKSAYMLGLTSEQLARYGSPGSERIYASLSLAVSAMTTASRLEEYTIEIGEAYTDYMSSGVALNSTHLPGAVVVTSSIAGVDTSAFHDGSISSTSGGYIALVDGYSTGISLNRPYVTISGIKVVGAGSFVFSGLSFNPASVGCRYSRCICMPGSSQSTTTLAVMQGNGNILEHSILFANSKTNITVNGVEFYSYSGSGGGVFNCLIIGNNVNGTGAYIQATADNKWSVQNTVIIDFLTNWGATAPSNGTHINNAGETGDVIWDTASSALTNLSGSWFVDYAGGDLRPAASSPLINAGDPKYLVSAVDIKGNVRPNYEPTTFPNNLWDVGPFEYDHGDGLVPIAATLTISANISLSGAEIRIYDANNTPAGTLGTELSGTESNPSSTYIYSAASLLNNTIYIQVMQSGYEEFLISHTAMNVNETLTLTLKADINA